MPSLRRKVKDESESWFVTGVLLTGWLFAVVGTFVNGYTIHSQNETMNDMRTEMTNLRRTLVGVVVTDPEKAKIINGLVSDARFQQGVDRFGAGQYAAAFSTWEKSAADGTQESVFAIQTGKAVLEQRIEDPNVTAAEKARLQQILKAAPEVQYWNLDQPVKPRHKYEAPKR